MDESNDKAGDSIAYINWIQKLFSRPPILLEKAIENLDSTHGKLRTLYRSQAYIESQLEDPNQYIAEGGDCALIELIAHELAETKSILREVLRQINPVD